MDIKIWLQYQRFLYKIEEFSRTIKASYYFLLKSVSLKKKKGNLSEPIEPLARSINSCKPYPIDLSERMGRESMQGVGSNINLPEIFMRGMIGSRCSSFRHRGNICLHAC